MALGGAARRRPPPLRDDRAPSVDEDGLRLGPAEVDPDDARLRVSGHDPRDSATSNGSSGLPATSPGKCCAADGQFGFASDNCQSWLSTQLEVGRPLIAPQSIKYPETY